MRLATIVLFIIVADFAEARVFSFTNSWVAGHIRGTGGLSSVSNDAYETTSGSSTRFRNRDSVDYNFSGEAGFTFVLSDKIELQVGLEGIQSKNNKAKGYSAGGSQLMSVDSKVTVFNPTLRVGYIFKTVENSRLSTYLGVGYATVKVANDYSLTSAGTTQYGGSATFKESWYTNTISYDLGASWEFFLFDNSTLTLSGGWRILNATNFTVEHDSAAIRGSTSTNITKGTDVTDNTGKDVSLDMGGAYVGVTFRFYIPPLD